MATADILQTIVAAASCERDAERSRAEADSAWRAAWWRTTLALAKPDWRPHVTATLDEAERILGQSRSYLASRRSCGVVFGDLAIDEVQALPPRLSMVWASKHAGQRAGADAIAEVYNAETDGVSLREFAARYDQTFERPSTGDIVAAARSNPEVADAIAADREARERVEEAGIRHRAAEPAPADIATPAGRAESGERVRRNVEAGIGERTDEATNYLRGAASELGHALFARDQWGINDPGAEAHAIEAVKRLIDIYEAAMQSGIVTDEDKQFLDSIGIHA